MAESKDSRQGFVDMEYCLDQYFKRYFAPIVDKEYNDLREKQVKEYKKALDNNKYVPSMGNFSMSAYTSHVQVTSTGEWNTKHSDYLMSESCKKFFSNTKNSDDYKNIVAHCHAFLEGQLGKDNYARLSAQTEYKDFATYYVNHRFETLIIEQLAKNKMPKSSMEYIMKKGFMESGIGLLMTAGEKVSDSDKQVRVLAEKLYNPSLLERGAGMALSFAVDYGSMGGGGKLVSGIDLVCRGIGEAAGSFNEGFDSDLSEVLTGDSSFIDNVRNDAKTLNPSSSSLVLHLNGSLKNHICRVEFDHKAYSTLTDQLRKSMNGADKDYADAATAIKSGLSEAGIKVCSRQDPPKWMLEKSEQECFAYATSFAAKAAVMRSCGIRVLSGDGKSETVDSCAQKAYDYARTLETLVRRRKEQENMEDVVLDEELKKPSSQKAASSQGGGGGSADERQAPGNVLDAWSTMLGLGGQDATGGLFKGLGGLTSALPGVLANMFTGKGGGFSLSNNLFSIGCILIGIFSKNKLAKMLFFALACGNMISKAMSGGKGGDTARRSPVRCVEYADEPLDPRIARPVMRGNTLVADIDGVPSVIHINDEVVDAYERGLLPLNTLANAVLRKCDEQRQSVEENYERQVSDDLEQRERAVALR